MRVSGLFAGVGGLELGLRRAGHSTDLLCEIDDAAHAVLVERFPEVRHERDIVQLNDLPPTTDLVSAGFPCQDLSQAGRTAGISGSRSGLVAKVFQLLEQRRVPWVLLENVPNMLQLDRGAAMKFIVARFEQLGYRWAYRVLDTRAFGLPQRRRRVFFLASREADPAGILLSQDARWRWPSDDIDPKHAQAFGFYWTEGNSGIGWATESVPPLKGGSGFGIPSPPAIWLPASQHPFVLPAIEQVERMQGFEAGWTALPSTMSPRMRWKLVGNAVSVPVAEWIGRQLRGPEESPPSGTCLVDSDRWPNAAYGFDGHRYAVDAGLAPIAKEPVLLSDFLEGSVVTPLSARAASGFYQRITASGLGPKAFHKALARYVNGRRKVA